MALHRGEFPEEPRRQVDQVDSLVDQLAAPRQLGIRAPLAVVSLSAAMAVASPQEHEGAQDPRVMNLAGLEHARVKPVVVS